MDSPTVKELIELEEKKLEEKSIRMLTVKEILRDKPLEVIEDVRKALPFVEGGDSEGEVDEEEEAEAVVEPVGEVEEGEETETS